MKWHKNEEKYCVSMKHSMFKICTRVILIYAPEKFDLLWNSSSKINQLQLVDFINGSGSEGK